MGVPQFIFMLWSDMYLSVERNIPKCWAVQDVFLTKQLVDSRLQSKLIKNMSKSLFSWVKLLKKSDLISFKDMKSLIVYYCFLSTNLLIVDFTSMIRIIVSLDRNHNHRGLRFKLLS